MLLQPTANYDLVIIEDYLAGNSKIKISIKKKWRRCHIRRALATVANRKCGPENGDNNIQNVHLGRIIVGYTFGNHVLRLRKTKFPTIYPTIYLPKCKF